MSAVAVADATVYLLTKTWFSFASETTHIIGFHGARSRLSQLLLLLSKLL